MYQSYYGLSGKPFSLLPDADFLYLSRRHRLAVNLLEYGMMTQAGFIVISGDVGAGKTTVIRRYFKADRPDVTVGIITNSSASFGSLLSWVAMAFDINRSNADDAELHDMFIRFLLEQYAAGKRTVLIIDEAQNLTPKALEDLRMLSNINNEKDNILQIILVGQPELLQTLNRSDLTQFVQRISLHCHLVPLTAEETTGYIRHRLNVVGGAPTIFDDDACAAVHYFSRGVPRLINLLCDVALLYGFSEDQPQVTFDTVTEAVADRNNTGLSPFRPVPDNWSPARLRAELAPPATAVEETV